MCSDDSFRLGDQRIRDRNSHSLQVLRIGESRVDLSQRCEGANHQAGTHQEHQRHRHLPDHQKIPRPMPLPAYADRSSRALQSGTAAAWPGIFQSRNQSEQQAGQHRKNKGESQSSRIDRDFVQARQIRWPDRDQEAHPRIRQGNAHESAHDAEHHAFYQKSSDDSRPAGPECRAHRQLLLPRFYPHQQQIGHIRASDQHDHGDGSHHHPQQFAMLPITCCFQRVNHRRNSPCFINV